MAAPSALTGCTDVRKNMMEATITEILLMITFPMLNVKGDVSFKDMYET